MLLEILFFYKIDEKNSTKFQSFLGEQEQRNYLLFHEFSRSTGKLSTFPVVFQGLGRKFQNSRSFPGILGVVSTLSFPYPGIES